MTTPAAAELVALAEKAATWRFKRARTYGVGWDLYVYGPDDFEIAGKGVYGPSTAKTPLLRAPLSPENTASPEALKRAVLRSAIVTTAHLDRAKGYQLTAHLGDREWTAANADDAERFLLDALLSREQAPEVPPYYALPGLAGESGWTNLGHVADLEDD